MKIVINLGLLLFLLWSAALVAGYFTALHTKITEPHIKNMNSREVVWFGLLAALFLVLDVLIIRRFVRMLRSARR